MTADHRKTLYLDDTMATLRLDGRALRVQRPETTDTLIPLSRVGRAVIRANENDLLQACLALVHQGGTVHIQDDQGNLCALLAHPWADGTRWSRELAELIENTHGCGPFKRWARDQQQHAWSLIFRRGYRGDFEANRKKLIRYLLHFRPELHVADETGWLEQQLWAWLQDRINSDGLQPVARAIQTKKQSLIHTLRPCLYMTLLWAYVRWRRRRTTFLATDRTAFFELQARYTLADQFDRHIRALGTAYQTAHRIEQNDSADEAAVLSEDNHEP